MIIGDKIEITTSFNETDVSTFAELCNDFNPIHLNKKFAENTIFGKRIVHGMLVSSLFSGLIAKHIPGPGSIYLSQTLSFKKPVFLNEEITASVEIINIRQDKPIYTLATICLNPNGEIVIDGEAIVLLHE